MKKNHRMQIIALLLAGLFLLGGFTGTGLSITSPPALPPKVESSEAGSETTSALVSQQQEEVQNESSISEEAGSSSSEVEHPSSSEAPSSSNGHETPQTSQKPQSGGQTQRPSVQAPSGGVSSSPSAVEPLPTPAGKAVVGYYAGWSANSGFTPQHLDAAKLTHLNYAFAKIDANGRIAMTNPAVDQRNFAEIRDLKRQNRQLKVLISVGGWDESGLFSSVAATAAKRERFAQSCVDFLRQHGLDGVDIDWEYPVSGGAAGNLHSPADKRNFTLLLQALRQKLDLLEKETGRSYYLTIAAAADKGYLNKIELANVVALVDHIFLMAYDMHGPWDAYADLNAPLYTPEEPTPQYKNSVDAAVSAYLSAGAPAAKLVLGMPFYGYIYHGVSGQNDGLYSAFSKAQSVSYTKITSEYLKNPAYQLKIHPIAQVPYLFGEGNFLSFENEDSIAKKVRLARQRGLGGVGAWELSHDRGGVLLNAAYRALIGG
jgi:chitinase